MPAVAVELADGEREAVVKLEVSKLLHLYLIGGFLENTMQIIVILAFILFCLDIQAASLDKKTGVESGGCQIGASTTEGRQNEYYRCLDIRRKIFSTGNTGSKKEINVRHAMQQSTVILITLTPHGVVKNACIQKSAKLSDGKQLLELVKKSAPFVESKENADLSYLLYFPSLKVESVRWKSTNEGVPWDKGR